MGSLGYQGTRKFGFTPVYRLDCEHWQIEPVETRGDNPGWIFKHRTKGDGSNLIVSSGTVCHEFDGEEQHIENRERFCLDLALRTWTRL